MIKKSEKSKLGDAPVVHPCIFQEDSSVSFFINLSGSSPETIFLFSHILWALLGASVCFYFCLCLNKFGS